MSIIQACLENYHKEIILFISSPTQGHLPLLGNGRSCAKAEGTNFEILDNNLKKNTCIA